MHACFVDASRAFDRVNHTKLLSKLKKRRCSYIYTQGYQTMCIRWSSVISNVFTVTNGVKQGGILSPLVFNFYMNDLSVLLSKIAAGCYAGNTVINHLMFADNLVVFSPSAKGLPRLLNICDVFGKNNDIIYNCNKSKLMIFDTNKYGNCVNIYIGLNILSDVKSYKYIGHVINNSLSDGEDMKAKERSLYGRSNMLIRKFYFCSNSVKCKLFMSYCSNVYLCFLWRSFNKASWKSITVALNNALIMHFVLF